MQIKPMTTENLDIYNITAVHCTAISCLFYMFIPQNQRKMSVGCDNLQIIIKTIEHCTYCWQEYRQEAQLLLGWPTVLPQS